MDPSLKYILDQIHARFDRHEQNTKEEFRSVREQLEELQETKLTVRGFSAKISVLVASVVSLAVSLIPSCLSKKQIEGYAAPKPQHESGPMPLEEGVQVKNLGIHGVH